MIGVTELRSLSTDGLLECKVYYQERKAYLDSLLWLNAYDRVSAPIVNRMLSVCISELKDRRTDLELFA